MIAISEWLKNNPRSFNFFGNRQYLPKSQYPLLWYELDIVWPTMDQPLLSEKDAQGKTFEECEKYE